MDLILYIERGGTIVYILILLNILGFSIMIWKLIQLTFTQKLKQKIAHKTLEELEIHSSQHSKTKLRNTLDLYIKDLEYGLNFIKIIATIAPLLGLLGTVVGVLEAFDTVSSSGLGDNAAFAGGISVALITTVAGLIVAIPHFIGYNFFISRLDTIELEIEKEILKRI